jgi:8-oxo-dGTP pyrophosphatase MutT (NUDIX family)
MSPVIHRITELDFKVEPWSWPFANARRGEIDAHFAAERQNKPSLWNGRVLLGRNPRFVDSLFSADYFETDFASFLAWRDWGFPDPDVFNGFGMGALLSSDGAFILGEMGQHTSNAGRIYFPAGTPDLDDVRADDAGREVLDIEGSVAREVEEETGLTPDDYRVDPHWDCIFTGPSIALMRILRVDLSGTALRARIEANLSQQQEPELAAIHLVRGRHDISAAMPRFVAAFIEQHFSA